MVHLHIYVREMLSLPTRSPFLLAWKYILLLDIIKYFSEIARLPIQVKLSCIAQSFIQFLGKVNF